MMKILVIGMEGLDPEILYGDDPITDKLGNFHQLMEMGCYGHLRSGAEKNIEDNYFLGNLPIWGGKEKLIHSNFPRPIETDEWELFVNSVISMSQNCFDQINSAITNDQWNYIEYIDPGLIRIYAGYQTNIQNDVNYIEPDTILRGSIRDYHLFLNDQLGRIFENISEDLIIMINSLSGQRNEIGGFFILAAPNNPLQGNVQSVDLIDLNSTLLELGGYAELVSMQGKSLISGMITKKSSQDLTKEEEEILRERLSGLGYIS